MGSQTIDYEELARKARQAEPIAGSTPSPGPTGTGVDIDYSGLADQARIAAQLDNPENVLDYTDPTGLKVYRQKGVPLFQTGPGKPATPQPAPKDLGRFSGVSALGRDIGSGYQSGIAGVDHIIGNIAGTVEAASRYLPPQLGMGGADIYKAIGDWARQQQTFHEQKAGEYADDRKGLISKVVRGATSAAVSLPITAAATVYGGPVAGMAGLGALETADQGDMAMAKGALEGAAMGKFIHVLGDAGRILRVPIVGVAEYAKNKMQGVDDETALANAINMAGLSAIGGKGEVSARELPGHIGRSMIPDIKLFREPLVKNQLNPMEQASQEFLTKRGVQTPVSMQTGDPRAAGIEGAVRKSMGGGYATQVGEQTRAQIHRLGPEEFSRIAPEVTPEQAGGAVGKKLAGDLEETRSTLAGKVSPTASAPELAGSKVLGAGKKAIQDLDKKADVSYKSAWEAERDPRNIEQVQSVNPDGSPATVNMPLPIDMGDLREALKPLADQYEYTLSDTDARASLGLKTMRQIINGPRIKPARAAELDLGMLKEAANNENLPELRDQSQGLAAASVKQLQQAIDAKLANAHYPGWDGKGTSPALRHLQAGRAATAQKYEVRDIYKGFGRKIEDVEPVAAFKRMTWSGDAGIEHLRDVARIAPEQMPEVGRAFIDNGGKWEGLGAETKKILFRDPELIKNLDDYYAKHAKFSGLADMEPVALFDKLTAQRGQSNQLLTDVAEQAPEQMPGLLRAFVGELWGRVTREGDIQKVQSTLDKWLTMDQKTKDLLVGDPELLKDLNSLFFSLKRLTHEVNPSGSGYIIALNKMKSDLLRGVGLVGGGALGFGGHGAAGASMGAGAGLVAGVGMEVLMNKAMARLLFDPRFTKLLTEGIKRQTKGDTTGANMVGDALSRMAAASGLREKLKEGLKRVVEEEEGSLKLPGRKAKPVADDDYTRHQAPPKDEPVSPYKSIRPLEDRSGGTLAGSLHDLRRAAERDPSVGSPDNQRIVLRDKDGTFVVGKLTSQDWIDRVKANLSADDMVNARKWYRELKGFFDEHFGKDGAKMALAWLSSQQNVSPSGGMMNVLRAMDQLRGMPRDKVAGLAEEKILAALKGEVPEGGYGAKLNDFVDSALSKTTRTWMGDDPRGGQPAVIDVWANRDVGKVDQKLLDYLTERFGADSVKGLAMDGKAIGETDYEYGSKFYNNLVDHLNKTGFDGGGWTGDQVQAVGWTAMQKAMGAEPEFASDLVTKNTRQYSFEVQPGQGAPVLKQYPWDTLSIQQQTDITKHIGEKVTDLAAEMTGAKITGREVSRGGYLGQPTINVQMGVFASPETFEDFGRAAGYLGQQSEVWHVRPLKSGDTWAYFLRGDSLKTPELQQEFWQRLSKRVGANLVPGYSPMAGDAGTGVYIVNPFTKAYLAERAKAGFKWDPSLRYWTAKDKLTIDAGIKAVADEMGLDLDVEMGKVDLGASLHNWANTRKKRNGHLQRLIETGRSALSDKLSNHAPEALQSWWKEAWDKYAGGGAGETGETGGAKAPPGKRR